ncbi:MULTISPECIES: Fic family protein [Dietzia]|uniref:Fic family protein n=2 Tax=Dietzia cinnamea TaxID=321318 RepID=A0A4R3ZPJ3_9ACTN|nr:MULTISPECIES: Fic family protein [Dietzia]MCT1640438.1 Fic family protein [Dietzia cinnamea]MCT1885696.1 Fic family protein [Dietzia cinnamea]MCT2057989.1 Fic family protein [Dietzia cinnamea]MCT2060859.1 Fic family protein [Dietzia cinnamea]MCT2097119.1 Fic family protein [Dietzia cinnamea]
MSFKGAYSDIVNLEMFVNDATGALVDIVGTDPRVGDWRHKAFVPARLPEGMPELTMPTVLAVGNARAALASLDSTARRLPDPTLLRVPTLRREAHSTSALEGTYAPLSEVLGADVEEPGSPDLREILNFEVMARLGFAWAADGRPLSTTMLYDLQGVLMRGGPLEEVSGRLRDTQVVVGLRSDVDPGGPAIMRARFVPAPPGPLLEAGLSDLVDWMRTDHSSTLDPVVAAAMSHYQFETLHPFRDGNGRLGRFLIVLHLLSMDVLGEPTLTVSPWFEARRAEYYDALLGVSTRGDWDTYVAFFARGLEAAARTTHTQMIELVGVQAELKEIVRGSHLRSATPISVVDLAVAHPTFTVRHVEQALGVSYGRANKVVGQLVELGVLAFIDPEAYKRRVYAPRVHDVILGRG